ncbi:MAG: DUF1971 domain-containing protein [Acidobacteriota bacterium]
MKGLPLPDGLTPKGKTPVFDQDTLPAALCREHALGPKRWGQLHILEGSVTFVDLLQGTEEELAAPQVIVIEPESPHRLALRGGNLRCRIEFFEERATP